DQSTDEDADHDSEREAHQGRIDGLHQMRQQSVELLDQRDHDFTGLRQNQVAHAEDATQHLPCDEKADDEQDRWQFVTHELAELHGYPQFAGTSLMSARRRWFSATKSCS